MKTGKTAYSFFWAQAFDCMPDFETITSTYLNLEIIVDENGGLTAYRYDALDELSDLLDKEGLPSVIPEGELQGHQIIPFRRMAKRT